MFLIWIVPVNWSNSLQKTKRTWKEVCGKENKEIIVNAKKIPWVFQIPVKSHEVNVWYFMNLFFCFFAVRAHMY